MHLSSSVASRPSSVSAVRRVAQVAPCRALGSLGESAGSRKGVIHSHSFASSRVRRIARRSFQFLRAAAPAFLRHRRTPTGGPDAAGGRDADGRDPTVALPRPPPTPRRSARLPLSCVCLQYLCDGWTYSLISQELTCFACSWHGLSFDVHLMVQLTCVAGSWSALSFVGPLIVQLTWFACSWSGL